MSIRLIEREDFVGKISIRKDSAHYYGRLTRAGPFQYADGIKNKDYENLKEVFSKYTYLPVWGSQIYGSHEEKLPTTHLLGYANNWDYNDNDKGVYGDVYFFKDAKDLSALKDPKDLPVSIKFDDAGEGETQKITALHHLAVSLNKLEDDRCGLSGDACTISPRTDNKIIPSTGQTLPKNGSTSDNYDLSNGTASSVHYEKLPNLESREDMSLKEVKEKDSGKATPDENTIRKEIDECIKSGKTEEECKLAAKRKERTGKWDSEVSGKMGKDFKIEELDGITLEDIEHMVEDFDAMKEENEKLYDENVKLKSGSNELLERLDSIEKWQKNRLEVEAKQKEKDLVKMKADLIEKGICETFLENRSYEQVQDFVIGLDGVDKAKLSSWLKGTEDTDEEEPIIATSLADMGKTIDDVKKDFEYLKL